MPVVGLVLEWYVFRSDCYVEPLRLGHNDVVLHCDSSGKNARRERTRHSRKATDGFQKGGRASD